MAETSYGLENRIAVITGGGRGELPTTVEVNTQVAAMCKAATG